MSEVNFRDEGTPLECPRHMMATRALHNLGDISRDELDLCWVGAEHGDYWVGNWVTGFGFFAVHFPKETTRELTDAEVAKYDGTSIQVGSGPVVPLRVRR